MILVIAGLENIVTCYLIIAVLHDQIFYLALQETIVYLLHISKI